MQMLLPLLEQDKLEATDPQKIAIQGILGSLASVLKDGFLPFLEPIMTSLLIDISTDVSVRWVKQDEAKVEDDEED